MNTIKTSPKKQPRASRHSTTKRSNSGKKQASTPIKRGKTPQSQQGRGSLQAEQPRASGSGLVSVPVSAPVHAPQEILTTHRPEILAPAGDMSAALAAFHAGADAVFLGLKLFSARMLAENFSTTDLARLTSFAHERQRKVYVAMNTFIKPNEMAKAIRLLRRLALDVQPDALIIQDPGFIPLVREAGLQCEIHLSTLANVSHQQALVAARELGVQRVIVPRELSLEEVTLLNEQCPAGLSLEIFVHGALCYCVSGRCWWSSYMGGKSGLRGRCVQPCRRVYRQRGKEGRFFSCLDLSLGQLVAGLLPLSSVTSWKIEGRRKSPHYVWHVTKAYSLLRDHGNSPEARQEAEQLLAFSLGRLGSRGNFTSTTALRSKESPIALMHGKRIQSASGLICGSIDIGPEGKVGFRPVIDLQAQDYLRVGYEDEPWHSMLAIKKPMAQGSLQSLPTARGKQPKQGTPVFLVDRKTHPFTKEVQEWEKKLAQQRIHMASQDADLAHLYPPVFVQNKKASPAKKTQMLLRSSLLQGKEAKAGVQPGTVQALWLGRRAVEQVSRTLFSRIVWWLPPVIWPNEEAQWQRLVRQACQKGATSFVCNAPWQRSLFPDTARLQLMAGPLCNITNAAAIEVLRHMGFSAAIISPELGKEDILSLPGQSPLPLGIVTAGFMPVGISRYAELPLQAQEGLHSPKKEEFWMRRYGQNLWIYPSWPIDLSGVQGALQRAGYSIFVTMDEHPPKGVQSLRTATQVNWDIDVL